ncbi:branched-chain amino acid aminotransferase [Sporosarcina globispora]|uniref:Branched-chain amino acid aminotransferase n=1 Tax=Sporosarcina globispora TaxID=1459 RepID=A0A0M0GF76_SPOGL|nr:hypothetical protein [Sporosarcina globispora]KON88494.1 branched-chain amino acid aminotransferase [Sporosarcina globispora]
MLKKRIENYLKEHGNEIYKEEKEFAEKHHLLLKADALKIKNPKTRFADAYIERGYKETEEVLCQETSDFLNQPIDYFVKNMKEFIYLESEWFGIIGADAISFEFDDLFRTYDVMLGLKLPKKKAEAIRSYLKETLQGDSATYDLMFNQEDGLWELNFALNDLEGFKEDMTINDAYSLIYRYLFLLAETIDEEK